MPKRQQKRLRRQEYPDHEDFEDVKSTLIEDEPAPRKQSQTRSHAAPEPRNPYREGQVVMTPDCAKNGNGEARHGTIIWVLGTECVVLDTLGFLHKLPFHNLYPAS